MKQILVTTPSRISLLGGGTDLANFSDIYGGFSVNIAISLKTHIRLTNRVDTTPNQYPSDCDPFLFDTILRAYNLSEKTQIHSSFDGKVGCGLGTSGSSVVALLTAITAYKDKRINPRLLAVNAWDIENNWLHLPTGKQDQFAAAFGGGNAWIFQENKTITQLPIPKTSLQYLFPYMLLVYIGGKRDSHTIQHGFDSLTQEQIAYLKDLKSIAYEGYKTILQRNIYKIAANMRVTWALKKRSNTVTNDRINMIYETAKEHGAFAGKLLGAGGGGYFLFLTEDKKIIMDALTPLSCQEVPFTFANRGIYCRIRNKA